MMKKRKYNFLILILIAAGTSGIFLAPFTAQRILAVLLIPYILYSLNQKNYIPRYIHTFFIIWFSFSTISLIWAPDRINGLKFWIYNFFCFVDFYALLLFAEKAKNPINSILKGWALFFLITIPIAIWELTTGNHLPMSTLEEASLATGLGYRVNRIFTSVTFGDFNYYTTILIYVIPFMVYGFIKTWKGQLPFLLLLLISFIFILSNSSRGGFLCCGIVIILLTLYLFRQHSIKSGCFLMILFPVLIFITIKYGLLNQILLRLTEQQVTSDNIRSSIYEKGLTILQDYYYFGCGIGGITIELLRKGSYISSMHNLFLEFLVQYGLIPFCFFLNLLWKAFHKLYSINNKQLKLVGLIFAGTLLPMSVINSSFLSDTIFWIYLASLYAIAFNYPAHRTEK